MRILTLHPEWRDAQLPAAPLDVSAKVADPPTRILLIDGNAQTYDEGGIARFVREEKIGLVA